MQDCLFCKIAAGDIPANKVYEDETVLAFHDIDPQAPTHIIVIPKKHLASVNDIAQTDATLVGHIFASIALIAKTLGLANGYRVVTNCGADGGQSVAHLHFHILGGRKLKWPPG